MLNTVADLIGAGNRSDDVDLCREAAADLTESFRSSGSDRADMMLIRSVLEDRNLNATPGTLKKILNALKSR